MRQTSTLPLLRRRLLAWIGLAAGSGMLGACTQSPPVRLYRLRSAAPVAASAPPASAEVWQLLLPVRVPDYLDREAILLPEGTSGVLALSGHRWAESLRDAVPRLLRQDLTLLRGEGRIWTGPVPAGLTLARQLRVEILAFEVDAGRSGVQLQARWTMVDPLGAQAPRSGLLNLQARSAGSDVDSLVAAHRAALWQLAEGLARLEQS